MQIPGFYQPLMILWDRINNSLWFWPLLFFVAGGLLSWLALRVPDYEVSDSALTRGLLHTAGASHAHDLLASLLTGIITMTSLAMSLTMVVLSQAASMLGPRLIRHFMGSRVTQVSLGIFMGTIIYLLLTMRVIHDSMPDSEVPHVAVTLGSLLAVLSLFTLVLFIHHLARSIVADEVVARVAERLTRQLHEYRKRYGGRKTSVSQEMPGEEAFRLDRAGYLQNIDEDQLVRALADMEACLELHVRPGQLVLAGGIHGWLKAAPRLPSKEEQDRLRKGFHIGSEPTPLQDIEFTIRQMVEIGLRALSPGINDTFTAVRVIDRLAPVLAESMDFAETRFEHTDASGVVRLVVPVSSFAGMLDTAYNQLRQAGADKPAILIRLLERLADLAEVAPDGRVRHTLARHVQRVWRMAEAHRLESDDFSALRERLHGFFEKEEKGRA